MYLPKNNILLEIDIFENIQWWKSFANASWDYNLQYSVYKNLLFIYRYGIIAK